MLRDHWREFPREIDSLEKVVPPVERFIQTRIASEAKIIHLYVIPQTRGFWDWFHDAPPRSNFFCLTRKEVLIAQEQQDASYTFEVCPIADILAFEVGTVLLKSWITFATIAEGEIRRTTLNYGTTFSRQFRDSILWLRALTQLRDRPPVHAWRMPGEEHISALPLKFNNAARNYWLDGETALASCFIAPVTQPRRLLDRLRVPSATATAIVVSDEEVCIIEEQGHSATGRWGQIWRFFPLDRIAGSDVSPEERFPAVRLQLRHAASPPLGAAPDPRSLDIRIPFQPSQQPEIDRVLRVMHAQCLRGTG